MIMTIIVVNCSAKDENDLDFAIVVLLCRDSGTHIDKEEDD